jgi:hypothetical protein
MHLNDADAVRLLKDFARVLQPGGKVIIVTTHPSWVEHNYTKKPVSGTVSLARNMGGATVQQFHRSAERMGDLFDRAKLGLFVRSQIPICSSASFSPRYRQNFGAPLYDLFVLGDARAESPTHENLKQRHVRQLLAEVWPPYAEESITLAGFRISLSSIESAQKATKLLPDSPPVQNPELILPSLDFTVVAYAGTVHMSFASEEGRSTTVDFPRGDRPDWAGHGKWRYNLTLKRFEIFRLPDAGNLPEEIFVVITRVLEESLSRKLKVIKMRLVK